MYTVVQKSKPRRLSNIDTKYFKYKFNLLGILYHAITLLYYYVLLLLHIQCLCNTDLCFSVYSWIYNAVSS